ncbi:hypothetical protein [Nocardiopsis baichengensis]|uniref:hypothetical protein n=1 Tax=Nocardiopsis baichengensis TaxID=280240 RepID=UPI0003467D2B|nr:hypothetical protein [Nocardiopsis baichengensis]
MCAADLIRALHRHLVRHGARCRIVAEPRPEGALILFDEPYLVVVACPPLVRYPTRQGWAYIDTGDPGRDPSDLESAAVQILGHLSRLTDPLDAARPAHASAQ